MVYKALMSHLCAKACAGCSHQGERSAAPPFLPFRESFTTCSRPARSGQMLLSRLTAERCVLWPRPKAPTATLRKAPQRCTRARKILPQGKPRKTSLEAFAAVLLSRLFLLHRHSGFHFVRPFFHRLLVLEPLRDSSNPSRVSATSSWRGDDAKTTANTKAAKRARLGPV